MSNSDPKPQPKEKKKSKPLKRSYIKRKAPKSNPGSTISKRVVVSTKKVSALPISKKKVKKWDHTFFQSWWNKDTSLNRESACIECGKVLHYYNPRNIHHLILKSKQKSYSLNIIEDKDNLVKLCFLHHDQSHRNIDRVPLVKELTERLKEKYLQYRIK